MHQPDLTGWRAAYEYLDALPASPLYNKLVTSDEERYFGWVLACVVPFARVPGEDLSGNLKKTPPAATLAAREGFRATNKISDIITAAIRHREEIVKLRDLVCSGGERVNERDLFGMAIRRWEAQGQRWRLQILFAMLDEVMAWAQSTSTLAGGLDLEELAAKWRVFVDHLEKLDLMDAASLKPLVDGRQLSQALGVKPGKWMSAALDVCIAWQLRNPGKTDPAGAVEEVRQRKEELGIAQLLKA